MKNLNIVIKDNQLVLDSREVAERTGKSHSHLLRDIDNYVEVLRESKFGLSEFFINSSYLAGNRRYKNFLLTKKGCDMVANKMTGAKGIIFTATYINEFERVLKNNKNLIEDNQDLYKIAVSEEEEDAREYKANKVKYGWRNLKTVLNQCTYRMIEEEVENIVNFHSDKLNKKDRANFKKHKEANKTEYKQIIRTRVYEVLNEIYNNTHNGTLRAVVSEVKEDLLANKLQTVNRSHANKEFHLKCLIHVRKKVESC